MHTRRGTGTVSFLTTVWNCVGALVHPSAQHNALMAARHRAFIAQRLFGSFAALAGLPVYIAFRGVPSVLELGVFGWLITPLLIAYLLSRTGRYESAHMMSSLSLTGLATVVAWCSGGIESFAAIWLVIVPLEAALSASRRVVALASILALAAAGLLLSLSALDLAPPASMLTNGAGRWPRSASFPLRSMPPGSRSAPSDSRGPAQACSMPKRNAIACSLAT